MNGPSRAVIAVLAVACITGSSGFSQDNPARPVKAPKPKSRMKLLQQMQMDLDSAVARAKTGGKERKKLDKCHEILADAIAQQQRYKSVNAGKINGCMKDLDSLDEAGVFAEPDRARLRDDREKLQESVGTRRKIHLPSPL